MPAPPSVIIGIHGLANKPPSVDKPEYWKRALIEGLKRNCGKTTNELSFDFVNWADPCLSHRQMGGNHQQGNRNCWNRSKFSRCAYWRDESRRFRFGTRAPGSGCLLC